MKPIHTKVLRVLAVLSSVTLLGVYVSCRARERPASPAVVADPAPQPAEQPPQVVPEAAPDNQRDVFVGSKSAAVFPKTRPRPVMPGSKRAEVWPPSIVEESQQPTTPAPQQTQAPK